MCAYPWGGPSCHLDSATWNFLFVHTRALVGHVSCYRQHSLSGISFTHPFFSDPPALAPSLIVSCLAQSSMASHHALHWPCCLWGNLANGISVPALSIKGLSVTLVLRGLSRQMRPLWFALCTSLPSASLVAQWQRTGDKGSIPGSRRSPEGGSGNSLQYPSRGLRSLAYCSPWGHKRVGHN